ncbi:MAG: HdeD family acid-resistance protein [Chloroflexi bacterium]|nr:HdeD family acid-resistance protein [Chloroflexota bacterium]
MSSITGNWWAPVVSGVLAMLVGLAAFVWPGVTFEVLVLLFGVYAFLDGVLWLSFGLLAASEHDRWWPLVAGGLVGIAVGVLTFAETRTMGLALVYVIGAWAVATGVLEIVAAIQLRRLIAGEWLLGLSGVLSVVFGVLVLAQPAVGAFALVLLFGFYATLVGASQLTLGLRLRRLGQDLHRASQAASSVTL